MDMFQNNVLQEMIVITT